MITVSYLGETYQCAKALKGTDYIHLLGSDGCMIAAFDGITDFRGFTISGGDWTSPTPNDECYLAVIGEDGVIRKGGHRCCDIPTDKSKLYLHTFYCNGNPKNVLTIVSDSVCYTDTALALSGHHVVGMWYSVDNELSPLMFTMRHGTVLANSMYRWTGSAFESAGITSVSRVSTVVLGG